MFTVDSCHNLSDLTARTELAHCAYLDPRSRRFFRSRVSHVWPTRDGAVITETIGRNFDPSAGRVAKCVWFRFYRDPDTAGLRCEVITLYNGLQSDEPLHVQKRKALACAKQLRYR